ncbi:MAG: hypothetical protein AAF512_08115 [Pseudomonadota bacterium]
MNTRPLPQDYYPAVEALTVELIDVINKHRPLPMVSLYALAAAAGRVIQSTQAEHDIQEQLAEDVAELTKHAINYVPPDEPEGGNEQN